MLALFRYYILLYCSKVYIATIEGYVPAEIIHTFRAFLKFCYLVRRHIISEKALADIKDALERFHTWREIFRAGDNPVVTTFSLPCQHSAKHYPTLIRLFGAPNGLCSSITECKHIKAVKEPWRRSSKYQPLGQMLLTNQRLDKLAASRVDFSSRGMMNQTCLSSAIGAFCEPHCLIGFRELLTFVTLTHIAQILLGDNSNGDNATSDNAEATHNGTDHTQQGASMQDDGDMPVADDSPMDLSVHVQLSRTPCTLLRHMLLFILIQQYRATAPTHPVHTWSRAPYPQLSQLGAAISL